MADAVTATPAATLRLRCPHGARWSVTDATGGAWFADGVPRKWDAHHRPYFHTDGGGIDLRIPAGPLHVLAAHGLEFERLELDVHPAPGATVEVDYRPRRRFDPAAAGWYGGDLHVHLNYSGDHVLAPEDAVRMQRGEGLHLMQLTAGNLGGSLVYDAELLAATAGTDLPGSGGDSVARAGLEFRNDLLGHVHGLGLTGMPAPAHTGHEGTDQPWDWPPNSVACAQLQALGGTTTYAHPAFSAAGRPGRPAAAAAHGGGPRAGRGRRAGPGRRDRAGVLLRRPRRRGALPPAAVLRAAAGRGGRHRRLPLLRARARRRLQPAGLGPGVRALRRRRTLGARPSPTRCAAAGPWSRTGRG